MSKIEVMFDLLIVLMKDTMRILPDVKFDRGYRVHRAVMALYASIIENTDSTMILYQAKKSAGIDIILRTNLEAYVDLVNLCSNEDYYNQMLALYHKDWLELTQRGLDGNPYLEFFKKDPEAAKTLEEHRTALAELQKLGRTATIFERFQMAGMEDVYRSVYKDLCSHTHNNIKALADQHFHGATGEEVEVVIFAPMGNEALLSSLDQFVVILATAGHIVHDYFQSPSAKEATAFHERRTDLQSVFDDEED
ncbi:MULTISPECIES: DUF5677 domain-containing protein [unclassified Mesorhizobium]|uniref:DUF5677 domain-containing protein n=1 Tax=unclassified Mesorhizobium TaxID=325217 RepID=UPI0033362751